ncbi:hypothetical protein AAG570_001365 [Ranatra chinensis]|uniref:Rho guanine nucleotide exchange factor 7 n=1 Tax=Ranatra chinensis TaxID=642074 RepID=A0ABD0YDK2_9HEMI
MANEGQPFLVQAVHSFKGKNNDELCFKKGDIITVTQFEEGGWWEGTLCEMTGWFPSNYVKEYKVQSDNLSPSKGCDVSQQRAYRELVLKDFVDSERAYVTELHNFCSVYLQPLSEKSDILTKEEYQQLVINLKEVICTHESLLSNLESVVKRPLSEQRVGKLFLTSAPRLKQVHHTYCAGHPRAVAIIEKHKGQLDNFCEELNGNLIKLKSGLSKPFRRMDKYSCHLQEVERHLEENHPDRGDTQRAVSVYKDISGSCSVVRRQKELELEVVMGGVRGWEGQDMTTLGDIIHMGSVAVGPEHRDRYFVLFPTTLLMLSVSHRMSAFIYEGKLPLTGITVNKLEDTDSYKNAFEIVGPLIEKITAVCQTKDDQQKWVCMLTEQCSNITAKSSSLPLSQRVGFYNYLNLHIYF